MNKQAFATLERGKVRIVKTKGMRKQVKYPRNKSVIARNPSDMKNLSGIISLKSPFSKKMSLRNTNHRNLQVMNNINITVQMSSKNSSPGRNYNDLG